MSELSLERIFNARGINVTDFAASLHPLHLFFLSYLTHQIATLRIQFASSTNCNSLLLPIVKLNPLLLVAENLRTTNLNEMKPNQIIQ